MPYRGSWIFSGLDVDIVYRDLPDIIDIFLRVSNIPNRPSHMKRILGALNPAIDLFVSFHWNSITTSARFLLHLESPMSYSRSEPFYSYRYLEGSVRPYLLVGGHVFRRLRQS